MMSVSAQMLSNLLEVSSSAPSLYVPQRSFTLRLHEWLMADDLTLSLKLSLPPPDCSLTEMSNIQPIMMLITAPAPRIFRQVVPSLTNSSDRISLHSQCHCKQPQASTFWPLLSA
ncbi:hypothetical protein FKM82_025040 [Ascaphus truei]